MGKRRVLIRDLATVVQRMVVVVHQTQLAVLAASLPMELVTTLRHRHHQSLLFCRYQLALTLLWLALAVLLPQILDLGA